MSKLPLWKDRTVTEDIQTITDIDLKNRILTYHKKCTELCKIIEGWISANK